MMKQLLNILLVFVLTACAQNGVNSGRSSELATDEAVLEALNKESKFELEKEDVCIVRPSSFPGLILVGFFAHDRGCKGDDCFYGEEKSTVRQISSTVLTDVGWKNSSKRKEIMLSWITEVQTVWETLLTEAPDRFTDGFSAPEILLNDDGSVTANYWQQEPSGMLAEANYTRIKLVISEKGEIIQFKTVGNKTIPY